MKKLFSSFSYIIMILNLIFPIFEMIARLSGMQFQVFNYTICGLITFLPALILSILSFFFCEIKDPNKSSSIMWSLFPIASILNLVFFSIRADSIPVILIAILNFILSIYLARKQGLKLIFRIALCSCVPFALLVTLLIALRPLTTWASGKVSVVETSYSSSGEYFAELIERDTGASGGEVFVRVGKSGFDAFIFSFQKAPQIIYTGKWGENIQIEWRDGERLFVNGVEYSFAQ